MCSGTAEYPQEPLTHILLRHAPISTVSKLTVVIEGHAGIGVFEAGN